MSDWEEFDNDAPVQYNDSNQGKGRNSPPTSRRWDNGGRNNRYGSGQRGGGGRTNEGYGNRNSRNNDHKQTIDLRSDCIGMIIGRGGTNIQRLKNDYRVRVNLDKERCTVTVSGSNEEDVRSAIKSIEDQIEKSDNRAAGGGRRGNRGEGNYRGRENSHNPQYAERNDKTEFYGEGGGNKNRSSEKDFDGGEIEKAYNENGDEIINWQALNERADKAAKLRWASCPPLTKNFYQEAPEVAALSNSEVQRIRADNNNTTVERVIVSEGGINDGIPNPIWKFEQCFAPYPDLLAEIEKQGFKTPSPIQSQAWPILLKGEDMIGIAQTGTGKTLAFLLPGLIHTEYQSIPRSERGGPNVLVMAPTRELALQIEKEVNKYHFRGMKAVCVYGGGSRRDQIDRVEKGVEIIISTPGRLNDLIQANVVDVSSVTYLVLDEADRMLDMGFEPQILKILLNIRPDRQTVMTSATWPSGVRRLVQKYMNNPIQVCVGSLDLAATHTVKQLIEILDEDDKYHTIKSFAKNMKPDDKAIVFCGKKIRADDLSSDLTLDGFYVTSIHGSREQYDREQAIADITSGEVKMLIATDVASRGLDIDDITHVINYDFPRNIEEYVHRVGRTGRAGRTGVSISYVTRSDWAMATELIAILEEAGQDVPAELRDMAERFDKKKERQNQERSKFNNNFRNQRSGGYGGGGSGGSRYRY